MAGTDITGLLEAVQKKINAVDSSASTGDLLRLLSAVRQSGTPSVFSYNGDEFPNLLDGTDDLQMLAYNLDSDKLYFQKDRWLAKRLPPIFQGTNFGYTSGGGAFNFSNIIDKFPFASNANATDVGDLTISRNNVAGQSSTVSGYTSGGVIHPNIAMNVIDKFSFAADGNATDVGDLTISRYSSTGHTYAGRSGYTSGGNVSNVIDKFPFASDANVTDVGDLTVARFNTAGLSSTVSGYTAGGEDGNPYQSNPLNNINKFSFVSDANATSTGGLTSSRSRLTGQSSEVSGYSSGGQTQPLAPSGSVFVTTIDKFPFASDGNAAFVGNITVGTPYQPGRTFSSGQSSTVSGYTSGTYSLSYPAARPTIDKFPFASDADATDVGDLTVGRWGSAGQQF